jgi:peptidase M28-like protein/PDZ domain-containing protein
MLSLRTIVSGILLFAGLTGSAQKLKKADKAVIANLEKHISYLADDKLEGRRAGTAGEKLAREYISNEFKNIGLIPMGKDGFYQPFDISDGRQVNPTTYFIINGNDLKNGKDFFPFVFSSNNSIEALPAISVQEPDMPWFFDLKETLEENKDNPHFDVTDFIKRKATEAKQKSSAAFIVYNTSDIDDKIQFEAKDRSDILRIPVIYVTRAAAKKFFSDQSATVDLKLKTDLSEKKRVGHNVIGYIDNKASKTVVIGAHYDHLGYGEDNNSMLRTGEKLIHNGADDNASGTAALMELARMLKSAKLKNNNYLFVTFSGEELGLFGSKYFVENPTIDLKLVNYMINLDMVGRLNDSSKTITIGGYGTSPQWANLIKTNKKSPLQIRIDSSGTGPSDHTSFYRKDIPVLFYFTGLHSDYHKPTDDFDKINYRGELTVIKHIFNVIETLDENKAKLVFTKTRETQSSTATRFNVTLGIMPDYTFSGSGIRVDGVSDGRPAQKAGLKTGDIIVQLGDNAITSMESYMQSLGKFKKGETTKVKVKRGADTIVATVQF